jgi:hypothetical protein
MSARVLSAIIAMALLCCADASAGTYTVTGCRTGWMPDVLNTAGTTGPQTIDYCHATHPTTNALYANLGGPFATNNPGDYAGWRFVAPPDTLISRATINWYGWGFYVNNWRWLTLETSLGTPPIVHSGHFDATETIDVAGGSWVRAAVKCAGWTSDPPCQPETDTGGLASMMEIRTSSVTLVDELTPVLESASGPAVVDNLWNGPEALAFSASDRGSGVYRLLVDVDGHVIKALPAVADDRCLDRTGARDFGYPVPCPAQTSASVSIDARELPAGQHMVAVYVEDAAGNRAAVIAPTRKVIVNDPRARGYLANGRFFNPRFATPRVLNGDNATTGAKLRAAFVRQVGHGRDRHGVRRASREVRYSQRATVRGKLSTPSGEPISHATVFIGQQPEGEQWRIDGAARTDAKGGFVYRPPARRSNRHLRAVYFPFSDSNENVTSSVLKLGVRAGMTLHVNRHRLRNGDRLVFTGRILGPVPAAGVAVTLQAKVGRHYRSFRQLRATSRHKGRIHTVYRFERTTQPARYRFRLKLVRQAGLPFQSGVSPVVSVSVSP